MMQRRWLELMVDYDIVLQYHPRKINVVPLNLSRKPMVIFLIQRREYLRRFSRQSWGLFYPIWRCRCWFLQTLPALIDKIKATQLDGPCRNSGRRQRMVRDQICGFTRMDPCSLAISFVFLRDMFNRKFLQEPIT